MPTPDIIIVGAGSAGCVLAHRLAKDPGRRILVVEPESSAAPQNNRERPSQWLNLLRSSDDWDYSTESIETLAGRSLRCPRGRGLGGSSRINAMIWFPPTNADFKSLATSFSADEIELRQAYADVQRLVGPESPRWVSRASEAFLQTASPFSGRSMSYQRVNRQGRRWNPASLLGESIDVVRATVDRLMFQGDHVVGIQTDSGEVIRCRKAVYLCAGSIATPAILMRSGIGPRDTLAQCGIDLRTEAPSVGETLQDHVIMPVIFSVDPKHRFEPIPTPADLQHWESTGQGPIASNIAEAGGLFCDDQIQIHVTPTHYLKHPDPNSPAAMTIGVNVTQPKSRGRLWITSADPSAAPTIQPNYLSDAADLDATIQAVRFARQIASQEPLASFITGELLPGVRRETDESIAKSIQRFAQTLYHPVGTTFNVQTQTDNLHIVDASALKQITIGNPNATIMTLASWFVRNG